MKERDNRVLLNNLYYDLVLLSIDYDTGFDELINSFEITRKEILRKEWINELCSTTSIDYLNVFIQEWKKLLQTKSYGCIGAFMQLDQDWITVVNGSLDNVIQSLKLDLIRNNWEVPESEVFRRKKTSRDKSLLKSVNYVTKLAIAKESSVNPFYKGSIDLIK